MLRHALGSLAVASGGGLQALLPSAAAAASRLLPLGGARGAAWSVEREPAVYKPVDEIIQHDVIVANLEKTKEAAKDPARVRAILDAAKERSFLTNHKPGG